MFQRYFDEGLAQSSFVIGCDRTREAVVIDPRRDAGVYVKAAAQYGLRIVYAIETHVHADFVSGSRELTALGVRPIGGPGSDLRFDFHEARDGEVLRVGDIAIRFLHTPGHTPEHISILVEQPDAPRRVFTGDTLFVGAVGRPDLLGEELTRRLAGELYDSLYNRLLALDDAVEVHPGHGAGSLCGAGIGSDPHSSIGRERRFNPMLRHESRDLRGGYGRFYDKTHFELIGGIFTNRVFASSFVRQFPLNDIDPNPRQGLLPTDPMLVGGPTLTDAKRALLEQQFGGGVSLRNTGATWDNPDRTLPYTDQLTVGYERQLAGNLSASVDYVRAFARDLLVSRQLNPTLRATTAVTSPNVRQGSALLTQATAALRERYGAGFANFTGSVTVPENAGETDYDAVMFQVEKRYSNNFSARVAYTLSHSRGNTPGAGVPASGFQVLDDLNLHLNEGPTGLDQRHNLVVSGTALVPRTGGLQVSWVARALSGSPFTLVNGDIDPDRNGIIAEPLPSGTYSGSGDDAYTVDFESKRNGGYGPGFLKLDLRLGYRFRLGNSRTLEVLGEIFNVTDRVNFSNPSGNQASTDFLRLTGYSTSTTPRTGQLGFRFSF